MLWIPERDTQLQAQQPGSFPCAALKEPLTGCMVSLVLFALYTFTSFVVFWKVPEASKTTNDVYKYAAMPHTEMSNKILIIQRFSIPDYNLVLNWTFLQYKYRQTFALVLRSYIICTLRGAVGQITC